MQILIAIDTDHPNADGIAHTYAGDIFTRFTRRPRFTTNVKVYTKELGGEYELFGQDRDQVGS
jgi:hypothetical protein